MSSLPGSGEPAPPFASRSSDVSDLEAIREFMDEGVVLSVLGALKSGKEATVYRCRAHPSLERDLVAVKVYHETGFRNFSDSSAYTEGRAILGSGQIRRAVAKGTAAGRRFSAAIWVNREFDVLSELFEAGADVPEPLFATERAILMEYVGDADGPAPQLQHAPLSTQEAGTAVTSILRNVELALDHHLIHSDLSAFNVLWWGGEVRIIDFPQAVDPRQNNRARSLLERDLRNIARFAARHGTALDPDDFAAGLWERYQFGDLG